MATTGTIRAAIRTGYAIQIVWEVTGQSVANNTSDVTARVQLVSTGSSYTINATASKSGTLTINGTSYSFSFSAALSGNQTKTIFTKSVTVGHSADGSKTCSFATTCGINVTLSGTYYGNVSASGNGVFNTIARASTIASVSSSVAINGTNTCAVSITRASSSFTHTVEFKLGSSVSHSITGVGTSTSYAIPLSWMNYMPSATSATATVTVTTYSGSTKIGSSVSQNFTVTVPSNIVPTISAVSVSEAEAGIASQFTAYVQNKSKLKVTVNAAGTYSSSITSYKTTINGISYTTASFTSGILSKSGSVSIETIVTDSRGRTATRTTTITVVAYSPPKINAFSGFRSIANGSEDYNGSFLTVTVNYSISSVNSKNTSSYRIQYKLKNASSWNTMVSGTGYSMNRNVVSSSAILSTDSSYDVRLTISDFFGSASAIIDIPTAFTLLDFNKSGRAVAFGKVSELAEGVEFGIKTHFKNGEVPDGAIELSDNADLNNVKSYGYYVLLSGSQTNKPPTVGTSTAIVENLPGGNTGQIIQRYTSTNKDKQYVFQRIFYGNAWGAWNKICGSGTILWNGALYMTADHTINLSEKISDQVHGICLVFVRYENGAAQDYSYNSFYISKEFVKNKSGFGSTFVICSNSVFSVMAAKYLYILDNRIVGHADNVSTGTSASGIKYSNNAFVLRYVIGV